MARQRNRYTITDMNGNTHKVIASNVQEVKRSCEVMGLQADYIQREPNVYTVGRKRRTVVRTFNAIRG